MHRGRAFCLLRQGYHRFVEHRSRRQEQKPRPNINGVDSDEDTNGEVGLKLQLGIGSEACLGVHPEFDA